jgi:uncharacterized protein (TIGR00369 family)
MTEALSDFSLAALLAEARQGGAIQPLIDALPYARFLRLEVARDEAGLVTTMRFHDELIGDVSIPALHGGSLAGLLESAAVLEVLLDASTSALPKTITLTIDYLRSGRAVDTKARARLVRKGRKVVVIESRAYQDDPEKPVATAIVHVLLAG